MQGKVSPCNHREVVCSQLIRLNNYQCSSTSSSPLSESNDLLGLGENGINQQSRRLADLGCDLDLLGINDSETTMPTNNTQQSENNTKNVIDDLQQLNNVFMQNQFGYTPRFY